MRRWSRNGSYAEKIAVPESSLVEIPDEIDDEQAAGIMIQGVTADGVLTISGNLKPGETVVVGAAGGTGSLAVQLARSMGAGKVIGLASGRRRECGSRPRRGRRRRLAQRAPGRRGDRGRRRPGRCGAGDGGRQFLRPVRSKPCARLAAWWWSESPPGSRMKSGRQTAEEQPQCYRLLARCTCWPALISPATRSTGLWRYRPGGDREAVVGGTYGLSEFAGSIRTLPDGRQSASCCWTQPDDRTRTDRRETFQGPGPLARDPAGDRRDRLYKPAIQAVAIPASSRDTT